LRRICTPELESLAVTEVVYAPKVEMEGTELSMSTTQLADDTDREPALGTTWCSNWFRITQGCIDAFAAATGDEQWIHQRDAKAAGSPFTEPIAHGLLLVSLAINLARDCGALPNTTLVLCGFDNLRFRTPVRSGALVRCLTTILDVHQVSGRVVLNARLIMEIEGQKILALETRCCFLRLSRIQSRSAPELPG
jgi:acyl dehydratase